MRMSDWSADVCASDLPGLNWHLPWPIETALTPSVTSVQQIDIGFQSTGGESSRTARRDIAEESLMLTGDQNIIDIDFTVQWKIADAGQYLFNIREPEQTVKIAAESARSAEQTSELQSLMRN